MRGMFGRMSGRLVEGWVWTEEPTAARLEIRVFVQGELVAEGDADPNRNDCNQPGSTGWYYPFAIELPIDCFRGTVATIDVRGPDDISLATSPKRLLFPHLVDSPILPPCESLPVTLALCAIVKNELPYLLEWIAWHRLVGVQRFVLFDNGSTDGTTELLSILAKAGLVDHVIWPDVAGVSAQYAAYNAGLGRLQDVARWVAFIDADEFLNPLQGEMIPAILADFSTAATLVVPWRLYGSNGHQEQLDEPVTARFTRRGHADHPANRTVKSIVQPCAVARGDVHVPILLDGVMVDEFGQIAGSLGAATSHAVPEARRLVINHYFTKSCEEWSKKVARGRGSMPPGDHPLKYRTQAEFDGHDLNDVEDMSLARWVPQIKAEIQRMLSLI